MSSRVASGQLGATAIDAASQLPSPPSLPHEHEPTSRLRQVIERDESESE